MSFNNNNKKETGCQVVLLLHVDFEEKPMVSDANTISCGIYVVRRRHLIELIEKCAEEDRYDFVQDILVFPKYQRKGVGSALLQAVLDMYRHVRQIELVTDNTQNTIAFYKSMGFKEMSEFGCCGLMKL